MAIFWWRVAPSWEAHYEARPDGPRLSHAQRSTVDFADATSATRWRHWRAPALCGARPPNGVAWDEIGNGWRPLWDRLTLDRIRAEAPSDVEGDQYVRESTLATPCPECERRTRGRWRRDPVVASGPPAGPYRRGRTVVQAEQWFTHLGAMQGRHGVWFRSRPSRSPVADLLRSNGIASLHEPVGFDVPVGTRRRLLRDGDWIVTGPRGGQRVVPAERFAAEYRPVEAP